MKTNLSARVILWTAAILLFAPSWVAAQCQNNIFGYCGDCTVGTPCCGYGPCNIFCGNCDGGCRKAPDGPHDPSCGGTTNTGTIAKAINDTKNPPPAAKEPPTGRALFDTIDSNHNGTISLAETKAWVKSTKSKMTKQEIAAGFMKADADADGDGKVKPSEFDGGLVDPPVKSGKPSIVGLGG
ncbi:MAG: EF-hand domain-containing protein [Tahibacter sp.]